MSTRIYCDGCGDQVGDDKKPNYWNVALMGDVFMDSNGKILDTTGLTAHTRRTRFYEKDSLRQGDVCIPCMSKIQEENEDAESTAHTG